MHCIVTSPLCLSVFLSFCVPTGWHKNKYCLRQMKRLKRRDEMQNLVATETTKVTEHMETML